MTWLSIKAALGGVWRFLAAIPWQAWAVFAILVAGYLYGEHRADSRETQVRAEWADADAKLAAANAAALAVRDATAGKTNTESAAQAQQASTQTRTETAKAVERVSRESRKVVVPTGCPTGLPAGVVREGSQAVAAARAANDRLSGRGHP